MSDDEHLEVNGADADADADDNADFDADDCWERMAVQMEQINARMAKSKDMNARLISFVRQCLKSPRFGVPPLSTSAPSSSAEASLSPAAASSSLSSSTDSLPTAGSSSFPPTFTTAKTSVSDLAEQELVALMTTTNGTPSPPALAPTPVDSKAVHGKIKHLWFPMFDGQNVVPFLEQLTMIITLSNCEDHTELWWAEAKTRVVSTFTGDAQKWILSKASHDSLHSWASFKTALQQTFSLADGTAARATMLKKLTQGNMGVRPFYDRWTTVYNEIYLDANEEVKFYTFCEKLSEHNQFLLSIWGCTSLADAITRLHNHETRKTKDNSSSVSQFINHIIKEHQTQVVATLKETEKRRLNDNEDSQADASSTSAVVTKKSQLELTPVVAAATPMDAHLVNLQAMMQKLVEEIKGIKQTQVSVTRNCTRCSRLSHTADVCYSRVPPSARPASQRRRFPLSQLPFHPANLHRNPNALPLPPASCAVPLQLPWHPDSTSAAHQASSDGAATAACMAAANNALTSTSTSTNCNWWNGYYSPLHAEVYIGWAKLNALLDTGAAYSLLDVRTWKDLGEPSLSPYTGPQVVGIGSVSVAIQGIAMLDILVAGTPVHGRFLVAPQLPSPVLVGMDILSVSGAVIDLKSRTLTAKLTIPVHL